MKTDREKLLSRASDGEERAILARSLDQAETVLYCGRTQVTDFWDPYRTDLIISVVQGLDLVATADGGSPVAERKRVAMHPTGVEPLPEDYNLGFLLIKGNFKHSRAKHRDFQGALLGLGLKREKFGDIIVTGDSANVVVAGEVVPYILANLHKVGQAGVLVSELGQSDFQLPSAQYREIKATVSSLRLDAVAAAGFGISRSKVVREIAAERLSINWRVCPEPAALIGEGDVLSARGKGRVIVAAVKGPLKSGRTGVLLHRLV
ncbi:MAG: YlmH/Sll1252 family protein [Desulfotomaculaceae bacterium]|nr:YlmH/Sll1252 family protein [Desulfotomaculaceae bacterium]